MGRILIAFQRSKVADSLELEDVQVPRLLPHEILYSLGNAGENQARRGDPTYI